MKDRCPRCGLKLIRHEGFSLGSTTINMVVTFGLFLLIIVVGTIVTYPHIRVVPVTIAGLAVAIIVPIAFLPERPDDLVWHRPRDAPARPRRAGRGGHVPRG